MPPSMAGIVVGDPGEIINPGSLYFFTDKLI